MPFTIAKGQFVRVRVYCYSPTLSQVGINTTYWKCSATTGLGVTDFQLMTALDVSIQPFYRALQAAQTRYSALGISVMQDPPSNLTLTSEIRTITSRAAGTQAGSTAPNQVSMIIAIKTGLAAKTFNGRIYPPFPAALWFNASGDMSAAALTALNLLAAFYQAPYTVTSGGNSGTFDLQVKQVTKRVRPLTDIAAYTDINACIGRGVTGTQRRRAQAGRINSEPVAT